MIKVVESLLIQFRASYKPQSKNKLLRGKRVKRPMS